MSPLLGRDVVIVGAVRTAVGRGHPEKGIHRDVHPTDLLGRAFEGLLADTGVDADLVDNVIAGCVYQVAEQAAGVTRNAWLAKGLPEKTGATTVDIRCGSGQQALHLAVGQIAIGADDVVIAAGVEHMGRVGFPVNQGAQEQWGSGVSDELRARYQLVPQGESAERIADRWEITRAEMDAVAMRSHRLASEATSSGVFAREIVDVDGHVSDQGIRPATSLETLADLKTVFREDGRVTAGNSSQISDGAAAVLLMAAEKAEELGLTPRARIVDQVVLGVDPILMLTGPIDATQRILERNAMTMGDLDLVEINEAFGSVVVAWARELEPDMDRVNVRGGAIALGHPLGATGARLITTLVHSLEDRDEELGLVTMCCGGGLGTATLLQRV